MNELLAQSLAGGFEAGGRFMASWSWQALLLTALTFLIVKVNRLRSSEIRHSLWLGGLIAVVTVPAWIAAAEALELPSPALASLPPLHDLYTPPSLFPAPAVRGQDNGLDVRWPSFFWAAAFAAWLAGFLMSMGRFAFESWRLLRLRAGAKPAGLRVWSPAITSPFLAGVLRPVIVLPADFTTWTSAEERRAIVRHELAHIRRADPLTNLFQGFVTAIFFFHPVVRYASRQLRWERELACDERVLRAGTDPETYAGIILKVAQRDVSKRNRHQPSFNPTRKILERRINVILQRHGGTNSSDARHFVVLAKAAIALGLMVWLLVPVRNGAAGSAPSAQSAAPESSPSRLNSAPEVSEGSAGTEAPGARPSEIAAVLEPPSRQSPWGRLYGSVYDVSGAVIPGVELVLAGSQSQATFTAISDAAGMFELSGLPPDTYRFQASLPGFRTLRNNLIVSAGQELLRNVLLEVGAISERVEVSATGPASSPQAPAGPQRIRVGGNVQHTYQITKVRPVYPPNLKDGGIEGTVEMQGIIATDGTVLGLRVLGAQTHPDFAKAAVDAVKQWRYEPTRLNGVPIEVLTNITVEFDLTP